MTQIERTLAILQKKAKALDIALRKAAELEEEAGMLADGLKDAEAKNEELAAEVGEKTEALAEKATEETTTGAISEESKDLLIETIAQVDPELADTLADEIEQAEGTETGVDAEKIATSIISVMSALSKKQSNKPVFGELTRKTASKRHSNPWDAASSATLDKLLNS